MSLPMKRFFASPIALVAVALSIAMVTGCAVALIGAGAGVGAAAYVMGEVSRTYERGYAEAIGASTETLEALKIPVTEKRADGLKTALKTWRNDGTPVEIEIVKLEEKSSKIGVRTGVVGVWDHGVSQQIQDMIGERLARTSEPESLSLKNEPPPEEPKMDSPPPVSGPPEPSKKKAAPKPAGDAAASNLAAAPKTPAAGFNPVFTVFFESGANELSPEGLEKLDRIADILLRHPDAVASLHGYSDGLGKASQNFILSVGRADSVKEYLAGKGCNADHILIIGHGATKFLGRNDIEEGRRLNRRVEIEIHNAR
jgi:outer membrane protein OmpA-like peptidoglycan-associated protein